VPMKYKHNALPIWLVSDGCGFGMATVAIQGEHWNKSVVCIFFANFLSAQQNYPIHKIEILSGVKSIMRHCDILQGVHFTWVTDNKGLIHFFQQ
ncbi:hypothetical protein ARMGADRAFT_924328, partial [Armillaria gallica]